MGESYDVGPGQGIFTLFGIAPKTAMIRYSLGGSDFSAQLSLGKAFNISGGIKIILKSVKPKMAKFAIETPKGIKFVKITDQGAANK